MKKSNISLIISMIIFGTIGIFRKFLPVPSGFLAFSRGLIGALFLLAVLFIKGERPNLQSIKSNLLLLLISGGLIGFNWILLFEAYNYTSVAAATLCYYMAPVFILLLSPFVLKEKLTSKKVICIFCALVGMVFVSGVFESGFSGIKGILLGLAAAVFYACVVLLNKKLKDISAFDRTFVQLFAAAVVILPYSLISEETPVFSPVTVILLITVGILHTGIAYALYFGAMDKLPAQTVAIMSYIDPVCAIILSAFLLREPMTVYSLIGAILILGSTLISEILPEKKSKQ